MITLGSKFFMMVVLFLSFALAGCTVYKVRSSDGKVKGIPFYVRQAECRQQTVYREDVRRITVEIYQSPSTAGSGAVKETQVYAEPRLVWGYELEGKKGRDLRDVVRDFSETSSGSAGLYATVQELETKLGAFTPYNPSRWKEAGAGDLRTLVSNKNAVHHFVDYSTPYYFNGRRPIAGSASISHELAADGTLSKGSASSDEKVVEQVFAEPLKTYLSSKLTPEVDTEESTMVETDADKARYRAALQIESAPVLHTLTRRRALGTHGSNGKNDLCPQQEELKPDDTTDIAYLRADAGSAASEKKPAANALTINGQITLPEASE